MRSATRAEIASAVVAGAAGVLHSTLPFIAIFLTGEVRQPSWTAPSADIVEFYQASTFGVRFISGAALTALAFLLLLVFLAKVAEVLAAERGSRWLARLILTAAAVDTAMVLAYLAAFMAAVFRASHGGLSPEGYLLVHDVRFAFYWLSLVTLPVWMAPLGIVIIRTAIFPRWLGWVMLATVGLMAVGLFLPVPAWDALSGLALLWILIAAVVMLARPMRFTVEAERHQAARQG